MSAESLPPPITPRRLQLAYLAVFGPPETRNEDQKAVMRDMESFCHAYRLSTEALTTGEYSHENTLVNEGRRSYWLRARGHILAALSPEPAPPKISRNPRGAVRAGGIGSPSSPSNP